MIYVAAIRVSQLLFESEDGSIAGFLAHPSSGLTWPRASSTPRGVKLSAAGKLFLEDARRILQEVNEATMRAAQVARGLSGTLRVGFSENASWRGVVPDSFRRFREQ